MGSALPPPVVNVRVAQGEGGRQREKQTFTNVPKSSEVSIESDREDIMGGKERWDLPRRVI